MTWRDYLKPDERRVIRHADAEISTLRAALDKLLLLRRTIMTRASVRKNKAEKGKK